MTNFEEQYEDVLQNIEFALVQVYRAEREDDRLRRAAGD